MGEDYGLYAYSGDVLSFLDGAVRTLEAAESLTDVEERSETHREIREARESLL
jgi:superfamily II helicase